MIPTCAACAGPLDSRPRSLRSRTAQGQDCTVCARCACLAAHRAATTAAAAATAAVERCAMSVGADDRCYICLEAESLVRGCACRGSAGFAHLDCLAELCASSARSGDYDGARRNRKVECWYTCGQCLQDHTGAVLLALARKLWCRSVSCCESSWERRCAATYLGQALRDNGLYKESLSMCAYALRVEHALEGADSELALTAAGNLASVFSEIGKYQDAANIYRQVHARMERVLGPFAPNTLIAAANLAATLGRCGRHSEAQAIHRQVAAAEKCSLGSTRVTEMRLVVLENLATSHATQGQFAEAEATYKDTIAQRTRLLGADHPTTLRAQSNLANALASQAKSEEARLLFVKTLAAQRRVHGAEHPRARLTAKNFELHFGGEPR